MTGETEKPLRRSDLKLSPEEVKGFQAHLDKHAKLSAGYECTVEDHKPTKIPWNPHLPETRRAISEYLRFLSCWQISWDEISLREGRQHPPPMRFVQLRSPMLRVLMEQHTLYIKETIVPAFQLDTNLTFRSCCAILRLRKGEFPNVPDWLFAEVGMPYVTWSIFPGSGALSTVPTVSLPWRKDPE